MSGLVNELLSFSKASLEPAAIKLQPVQLGAIVGKVVYHREGVDGVEVKVEVDQDLSVVAATGIVAARAGQSHPQRGALCGAGGADHRFPPDAKRGRS